MKKKKASSWVNDLAIREGIQKLNNREKLIINQRFFEGKTQMEVADEIGISQAQVSRLEKTAIEEMNKNVLEKMDGSIVFKLFIRTYIKKSRISGLFLLSSNILL